jgi:hypothetical protein
MKLAGRLALAINRRAVAERQKPDGIEQLRVTIEEIMLAALLHDLGKQHEDCAPFIELLKETNLRGNSNAETARRNYLLGIVRDVHCRKGPCMIDRLREAGPALRTVQSLPRGDFATLLAGAAALVGNSSSGIIEAPLLGVPAVNVGRRQEGRTRGDNVVDAPADAPAIADAIRRATDPAFRAGLSRTSPYGSGEAAPRILDLLAATPRDERLRAKRPPGSAG